MPQHVRSITLVRHGRTAYNAERRLQGQIDIPLDEVGRWQAGQTAAALKELYVNRRPDVTNHLVVCSDLGRAVDTARAFADLIGVETHPDARVRERNFGEWEGMSGEELAERYPEDFRLWQEHRDGELKHGAEPKIEVGRRGVDALLDWSARGGGDTDLYVFSHGAWISETLQTLMGLDVTYPDFASILSMRNAHWSRLIPLDFADGGVRWRLADYNHGPQAARTDQWEHPAL
ncbi:histidine phosphatase family protein [Bifidobacterium eulemuris]|uniref:Histidine phosphatase family protein n=1 Tax=Bifidobacterium eulemuris TaxID=1765219 RepID=A0A261GCB6_9BIFI|nr:histidine phosphatase family protein [Bifidobacterium eulemuris]OZG69067.1 phosphoglycerate mutase [Bifidobacterium eulemuris]QOL31408.1 histidine phosphatase family protein [Bifidobacterium eulemuris]